MPSLLRLLPLLLTALLLAGQQLRAHVNPPSPILVLEIGLAYDLNPAAKMCSICAYDANFGATASYAVTAGHLIATRTHAVPTTQHNSTHNSGFSALNVAGKQHVAETGLDYFRVRYLLAQQGRSASPDGLLFLRFAGDPQSWDLYSYDTLDNLTRVEQGAQVRTFDYTSLSRLRSSTHPEYSGAVQYTYDNNGNLIQRQDPRGVVTTWTAYDALQRPTSKTYTDGTPGVTYTYDQGPNAFGHLTSVATSASTTTYSGYDPLGRITASSQVTNGASYNFAYTYDLADNVRSLTLPTGRILSYAVDPIGRTATVSGLFASQPRTYLNQITYAPNGASRQWQLGNGLWTGFSFNTRQQVSAVTVGTAPTSGSLLSLGLSWSNNGNLTSQTVAVPGATRTQTFGYDALNRLELAEEASGGVWRQAFQFDQYGNRWQSQTIGLPLDPLTPLTQNFFVPATNRLQGGSYDAAGNQLVVNPYTMTYDAENRQRTVRMTVAGQTFDRAAYAYDGEGRRVRRVDTFTNGPAVETVFVYDAFGRLAVEYGGTASEAGTRYLSTDHLGSTRLVTSQTGAVIGRRDLTPFGEVIPAGTGGRSGEFGAPTGTSNLFTGKERDSETGLDYFGARYLSAAQGRFTSPDLPLVDQHAEDPQSWNLYGYVRNNPLRFIDPTGRACVNSVSSGFENDSLNGQACFTATSTADRAITNPFFFAVAQGANRAAPVVNALGVGLALGAEMATGVPIGMLAQLGSSDTAPAAGQSVEAGTVGFLLRNPQDIRFTQNSISAEFRNGQNIGSTIDALRTGATSPSEIPAIRTFERKGLTYTLDNRRLFAASEAGTQVATRPASASEILRNAFKFTTTNEGRFIGIRGAVKVLTRGRF